MIIHTSFHYKIKNSFLKLKFKIKLITILIKFLSSQIIIEYPRNYYNTENDNKTNQKQKNEDQKDKKRKHYASFRLKQIKRNSILFFSKRKAYPIGKTNIGF